jgi:S-formylglutathione hydrolase
MTLEQISAWRSHGGEQRVVSHLSSATGTRMTFAIYLPPQAETGPCPVLWYLSGLTCTHANVMEKGEYRRAAAERGVIVVCPDTSPRGEAVADDDAYDLGQGAGFYLDATEAPWTPHFQMERYIRDELPELVAASFPADPARQGIFGHSMGGHGALTLALKNPDRYRSVSAFAPIVAPVDVPWGRKALSAYLGDPRRCTARQDRKKPPGRPATAATGRRVCDAIRCASTPFRGRARRV